MIRLPLVPMLTFGLAFLTIVNAALDDEDEFADEDVRNLQTAETNTRVNISRNRSVWPLLVAFSSAACQS
jgi:hypothetical protein